MNSTDYYMDSISIVCWIVIAIAAITAYGICEKLFNGGL